MNTFFAGAVFCVILLMLPYVRRIVFGPHVFNRLLALNAIGTLAPVAIVLIGLQHEALEMFVDLALGILLLNIFTTLLVARYVRHRRG